MTSRPTGRGQRVEVTGGDIEGHAFFYLKQVCLLRIISCYAHCTGDIFCQ